MVARVLPLANRTLKRGMTLFAIISYFSFDFLLFLLSSEDIAPRVAESLLCLVGDFHNRGYFVLNLATFSVFFLSGHFC